MRPKILLFALCMVLAISPLAAACSNNESSQAPATSTDVLNSNYALWISQNITDYSFTLQISMFIGGSGNRISIDIHDGVAQNYDQVSDAPAYLPDWIIEGYDTIDKLFANIKDAYESQADSIAVSYDTEFGFPSQAAVDPVAEVLDEQWGFTVSDFTPLPDGTAA